jgi:Amt family ammonium transporter
MGGMWGALATGIFASTLINPDGAQGLLNGNSGLLLIQLLSVVAVAVYVMVVTYALLKITDRFFGIRVSDEEESVGLDISQHGERAYA